MLELIYSIQNYLAAEGSSINNIVALFCALIALILFGYLMESKNDCN